jgi:hypothetical protein
MNYRNTLVFFGAVLALLLGAGIPQATAGPVLRLPNNVGWLQLNYEMQLYGQWRDTGSGPNRTDSTTDIYFRRNRFSLWGMTNEKFGFYYAMENQGDRTIDAITVYDTPINTFFVLDAFMIANFTDAFNLRAGLFKDPLVREHNVGCFFPLTLDRSYFIYTSIPRRSRDYGALLWGNLLADKFQYKLAATKGIDGVDTPGSDLRYTARVHYSILDPENLPLYFGTYFGKKKILTIGGGYQFEKDAAYGNVALQTLAKDYSAWTVDVFGEYPTPAGTFSVGAAYLDSDFEDAYQGGDPDPVSTGIDGEKNGYYVKAAYLLPQKTGPGFLQFYGRYENWSFAKLNDIVDQEIDWYSVGVNYYINGNDLRLTAEWAKNDFNIENTANEDFNTATLMLQYRF